jgi:hypothetical protein
MSKIHPLIAMSVYTRHEVATGGKNVAALADYLAQLRAQATGREYSIALKVLAEAQPTDEPKTEIDRLLAEVLPRCIQEFRSGAVGRA